MTTTPEDQAVRRIASAAADPSRRGLRAPRVPGDRPMTMMPVRDVYELATQTAPEESYATGLLRVQREATAASTIVRIATVKPDR